MHAGKILEPSIQHIGRTLAEHCKAGTPAVLSQRWWNDLLMDWGMQDEDFKVQLFRFVDVLPTLKTDEQFTRLLAEYFSHTPILPQSLKWSLQKLPTTWIGAHVGALVLRRQFTRMAYTFIAGDSIHGAMPVLKHLWRSGRCASVDLLGETTVSEAEADEYRDRCLDALRGYHEQAQGWPGRPLLERDHLGLIPRVNLSVKISALYSQLDPADPDGSFEGVASRLRPILNVALQLPASLTFDMEHYELKDLTYDIFMRIFSEPAYRDYPWAGIALQAYLRDADRTLDRLVDWARQRDSPITIRLVKGAYWDAENIQNTQRGWPIPVLRRKTETDANFEYLSKKLLAHPSLLRPAFGTHNLRSLAHAEAVAQSQDLSPETCEYQSLYGMADSLQRAIVQYGRRVRVYTPVGKLLPGMAYLVRRLLENTSNESFLSQQRKQETPLEALLAQPETTVAQEAPASQPDVRPHFHNEPHTDFSRDASRHAMTQAIERVKRQLGQSPSFPVPSTVGQLKDELVSTNPSRPDEVIARVPCYSSGELEPVIQTAREAFQAWRTTPAGTRADYLRGGGGTHEATPVLTWPHGKFLKRENHGEKRMPTLPKPLTFSNSTPAKCGTWGVRNSWDVNPGELNHLEWLPRGVAVVISPWNFSLAIPTGMVSAALVTGNTVLFKPSERSPMMGYHLFDLYKEAGLPEGVLSLLPGGPEIGKALGRPSPDSRDRLHRVKRSRTPKLSNRPHKCRPANLT